MLAVNCSRNEVCRSVKLPSEASSITALTWPSNSTGSTIKLFGFAWKRPDVIGTTLSGICVISIRRASRAHWPIRPWPGRSRSGCPAISLSA